MVWKSYNAGNWTYAHTITHLRNSVRGKIDKEDYLATLDIKAENLNLERKQEEKQQTSTNIDGSSWVFNVECANQIE